MCSDWKFTLAFPLLLALVASSPSRGGDWPAARYDAQRSAASPHELPATLKLAWTRQLPKLRVAWPDQPKMQLDAAYEPIVVGERLFVGSSFDDSLTAYDSRTGALLWRFFAEGPIRFAPVAWQDKLYLASDDGYLYCLQCENGSLAWKFRGGPADRKVLGNERMISTWPARGAPVVQDGRVYFAAGIWPFMGIFLHALDAETGAVEWTNDGDGSIYIKQPHNTDSFAGVAPQGPLVAIGSRLLIPGGRSVPACYERDTGKLMYYQLAEHGKRGGGSAVAAVDQLFFNGGAAFDLATEKYLGSVGELLAFDEGKLYEASGSDLRVRDLTTSRVALVETVDRKGVKSKSAKWTLDVISDVDSPRLTSLIKAGARLYGGYENRVAAYSLPLPEEGEVASAWEGTVNGTPINLAAADDRLFVVTREGFLHCFAAATESPAPMVHKLTSLEIPANEAWSVRAAAILKEATSNEGYALAWGVQSGGLIKELARQSSLRIVVVEPDAEQANRFRGELHSLGISADRIAVLIADSRTVSLPPYFASLNFTEKLPELATDERRQWVEKTFASLRPFGGCAYLPIAPDDAVTYADLLNESPALVGAALRTEDDLIFLTRPGALPDSANWTHEHADAANTRVSKDRRVKAPLGLLWFGGSTNDGILPRHGHGPQPQVVDGRLFIEGIDMLRAMDIYTGRVLWDAPLPGVGALYDNTAHQPGANASGTNYIATPDGVYVAYRSSCLLLDPATGKQLRTFKLPKTEGAKTEPLWGYLNVFEDYLIGGADPVFDPSLVKNSSKQKTPSSNDPDPKAKATATIADTINAASAAVNKVLKIDNDNYSSSQRLIVMNRQTGKVLWTAAARSGFRHNAICIGGGKLFCIDRLSAAQISRLKRRGETPEHPTRLIVFDLHTGRELWKTEEDVFGTWLSYSNERDVLIEAGRPASDTLSDEARGMRAYRGRNGAVLWSNKSFSGPAMIHHDTILMAGKACHLLTGAPHLREHPLSGEMVEWTWARNYGCNTPMASEHLLTFRSGAAGYFDLCNDGGTGNFGGFKSSCTNNLVVAGGLLTAPDYTRTCTCSYQNQTSLALVHMPEAESWTSFGSQTPKQPVRRVGLNFGAPGDRKAEDGTLWLEYPSVGGASPAVSVKILPEKPEWFRRHSSQLTGPGLQWVASSGAKGVRSVRIKLGTTDEVPADYTVRLHFTEPDEVDRGERLFSIQLQGETVAESLDVVRAAGGRNRPLVKEFKGVTVGDELLIELAPSTLSQVKATLLSGIEIQAEKE